MLETFKASVNPYVLSLMENKKQRSPDAAV